MTHGPAIITSEGPPKKALPAFTWGVGMVVRSSRGRVVRAIALLTRAGARESLRFAQDDTKTGMKEKSVVPLAPIVAAPPEHRMCGAPDICATLGPSP